MKKFLPLFLLSVCLYSPSSAQSCLADGITFETQADIDNFQSENPGCVTIEGNVLIKGDEISDLSGLSVLTGIDGRLRFYSLTALENMQGLNNLTYVGGDLDIYTWPGKTTSLISLSGLDNIETVGGDLLITGNDKIATLEGLNGLITVEGNINISGNILLANFNGLDSLTEIGADCWIGENPQLENLEGIESLHSIGGYLELYENGSLQSLDGLSGLHTIGSTLKINNNDELESLSGMEGLNSIGSYLEIYGNDVLVSIDSMKYLDPATITSLYIGYNTKLSMCALENICQYIATTNATVDIEENATGCENEASVEDACASNSNVYDIWDSGILFPNPAIEEEPVRIISRNRVSEISIYTITGSYFHAYKEINNFEIVLPGLPSGQYIIKVENKDTHGFYHLIVK